MAPYPSRTQCASSFWYRILSTSSPHIGLAYNLLSFRLQKAEYVFIIYILGLVVLLFCLT